MPDLRKSLKGFFVCIIAVSFLLPFGAKAEATGTKPNEAASGTQAIVQTVEPDTELFEAQVIQVVEQREVPRPDGSYNTQQHLRLKALTGKLTGREFEFNSIGEIDAVSANIYRVGDRVMANRQVGPDGTEDFYVVDFVRRWPLFWLTILFVIIVIIVSAGKGLRALLGLSISFAGIMGIAIPLIFRGWSPLWVWVSTASAVFIVLVYLSEGINKKSNLAVVSAFICLVLTAILASFFTWWSRLTGMAQEETMFLIGLGKKGIDFSGLFLAGIMVGTLGVLDDMILGQIEAVSQIKAANPSLPPARVVTLALRVGHTHIGAMVNTLFLAYAGASLPLLLLFSVKQPPFLTFAQVVNNETVASEIVRTLIGSIGLVLAMPISTYLAAYHLKSKNVVSSKH